MEESHCLVTFLLIQDIYASSLHLNFIRLSLLRLIHVIVFFMQPI